ncbi:TraB/GumN family protein [Dysgonomonas sp. ZJ279]|uniref:TraB/GumN family protein n=1 Tax=Dysgonomonas sp. ZJ279 TaxID=2709796 RepID=UPI0013EB5501|nr:TraB/GumN family protein [Dysgonomonas sp. ZJ279]
MKKAFITLVLLIFTATIASAQDINKLSGSLLWKISGNGITRPSYIVGTHHLAPVSFTDSISGLKEALNATNQVVGEILMGNEAEMQAKLLKVAMMPDSETYHTLLSKEDYEILDKGLNEVLGVGLDKVGRMRPGILSTLYSLALYTKLYPEYKMGQESIDEYLQRTANDNGKTILGLESIEDQVHALLDSEPMEAQIEVLICTVSNNSFEKETADLLNDYYYAGNLTGMYNLALNDPNDPCPTSKSHKDALLKNRNNKWIGELPAIMKDKPSMIAVGALHLAGEEGLLYQLSKLGYTVEAVK